MKDKTKKIIAGIGLGAVLATGGIFMTGCTMTEGDTAKMMGIAENADQFMTDLKEDMDNLNTNLDELQSSVEDLKKEEGYWGEEAKIKLINYIYKALENNDYTSMERVCEFVQIDAFGNKSTDVQNYKYYNNGDIIKEYKKSQFDGDVYKESVLGENGYTSKIYRANDKTCTQEENIENVTPMVQTVSGILNVLLSMVSDDLEIDMDAESFSATVESENAVSFKFKVQGTSYGDGVISFVEVKFENGKLVQMITIDRYIGEGVGIMNVENSYTVQTITFKYNIEDFTYDVTDYIEV